MVGDGDTPTRGVPAVSPSAHLVHGLDEEVVEKVPLLVCDALEGGTAQGLGPPLGVDAMTPLPVTRERGG